MIPVSICLTTWNRSNTLPQSLDSLLAQSYSDFELIISDDCSTDLTQEVGRAYTAKDSRVRYYRNPQNLGMPGNLNAAIGRASGQFIANLHDGDLFRPTLIAKWKEALDNNPNATFAFNEYEEATPNGTPRIHKAPFQARVTGLQIAEHFFRTTTSCIWGTVMARSSSYQRSGMFNPTYGFISDVEMWLRLSFGAEAAYISEPLIFLGPRPKDHPFRHGMWRAAFWTFMIYKKYLDQYESVSPALVAPFRRSLHSRRRRYFIRLLLSCIRHGYWGRLKEGFGILADADDITLRLLGRILGRHRWQPPWYNPAVWTFASPSTLLNESP